MLREGTGPISWLSITLRHVPHYCHTHFVLQQLMLASTVHFYAGPQEHFWPLGLAMGLALFQSLPWRKKPMQIDRIGVRTSHVGWSAQTLDALSCIWGPPDSNPNPSKVISPGQPPQSPRSALLVQPWPMKCGGLPHICSDSAHGRKKALQTSRDTHIYMCTCIYVTVLNIL